MCIIAVKPKGIKLPNKSTLYNCYRTNQDGIGVAYLKDGENLVNIKKDFATLKSFKKWLYKNISINDTAIIHFRFATSGLVDNGNCHPFPITNNVMRMREPNLRCKVAIAHNGVLNDYSGHNKFSDTQKFISDILSSSAIKDNIFNPEIQKLIEHYIEGDRLSILNGQGDVALIGDWQESGGIHYSNGGFKPFGYQSYKSGIHGVDCDAYPINSDYKAEDTDYCGECYVEHLIDMMYEMPKEMRRYSMDKWICEDCYVANYVNTDKPS